VQVALLAANMASNPAASLKATSAAHAERTATAAAGNDHDDDHSNEGDDLKKADPEDVRGRKLRYNKRYNSCQSRKLLAVLA
jgi:hypothetical protein